jgi:hypothetical protein
MVEPEMKRGKKLERQKNEVLSEFKKSMLEPGKLAEEGGEQESGSNNRFNAREILNNTVKFRLTSKAESEIPVN